MRTMLMAIVGVCYLTLATSQTWAAPPPDINPKLQKKAEAGDVCAQVQLASVLMSHQGSLERARTPKMMERFMEAINRENRKNSKKIEELKQSLEYVREAANWYRKAVIGTCTDNHCKNCVITARDYLARLYEIGKGVEQSDRKAFMLYSMPSPLSKTGAAEDIMHPFHLKLSTAYYEGKGTQKNPEKAYYHLRASRICYSTSTDPKCLDLRKTIPAHKLEQIEATITRQMKQHQKQMQEVHLDMYKNPDKFIASLLTGFEPNASEETKSLGGRLFKEVSGHQYDIEGIKKLIAQGAPVNLSFAPEGNTILMSAAGSGRLDLIEVLLSAGADIDAQNTKGFSPLIWAIRSKQTQAAMALIQAGADVNLTDTLGDSTLMNAIDIRDVETAKALIQAGADIHYTDTSRYGSSDALLEALEHGQNELAELLISSGAQIKSYHKPHFHDSCDEETATCPDGTVLKKSPPSCIFDQCPHPETSRENKNNKAQNPAEYKPVTGTYSEIETASGHNMILKLSEGTSEEKEQVIKQITDHPGDYDPRLLKALCEQLFLKVKDDEAVFWCLAAQLRARYDALICQNEASSDFKFGFRFMNARYDSYFWGKKDKIQALIKQVIEWDQKTPYNYDPRWVTVGKSRRTSNHEDPLPENLCTDPDRHEYFRKANQDLFIMDEEGKLRMEQLLQKAQKDGQQRVVSSQSEDVNLLVQKANTGDKEAQYLLSKPEYQNKRGIKDYGERIIDSEKWLINSARQNYPPALLSLGQLYLDGHSSKFLNPNEEQGIRYILEAASLGQSSGFSSLGHYYKRKKNYVESFAWYSVSEAKYNRDAKRQKLYVDARLRGDDIEKARTLAKEYIERYPKIIEDRN